MVVVVRSENMGAAATTEKGRSEKNRPARPENAYASAATDRQQRAAAHVPYTKLRVYRV